MRNLKLSFLISNWIHQRVALVLFVLYSEGDCDEDRNTFSSLHWPFDCGVLVSCLLEVLTGPGKSSVTGHPIQP